MTTKEKLYYLVPVAVYGIVGLAAALLFSLLDTAYAGSLFMGMLALTGFLVGLFSPSKRAFDPAAAILMAASVMTWTFLLTFLERSECVARFDLGHALNYALDPACLKNALIAGLAAAIGSVRGLRIRK